MEEQIQELKNQIIELSQFNKSSLEVISKLTKKVTDLENQVISIKESINNFSRGQGSGTAKNDVETITDMMMNV